MGTVLLITIGSGLGSASFIDGKVVPQHSELNLHIYLETRSTSPNSLLPNNAQNGKT